MTLGDIVKKYREEHGMSMDAFSAKSGISKAYISLLEKNRHPKTGKPITPSVQCIKQAANAMGVDFNYLFPMIDGDVALVESNSDLIEERTANVLSTTAVRIPVLGRVAAGIPISAITDIIDYEEISEDMAKTGEFFALQIKGDSMEPRIMSGDVVVVRQQDDAESGDVVIALVNGDDAVCKRLRKYRDGLELISNNPAYAPLFFDEQTVQSKPVRIIGKVIELRGKF